MWKNLNLGIIVVALLPLADAFAVVSRPAPFVVAPGQSQWAIARRAANISMQAPKIQPPPKDDEDGTPSMNPNEDTVVHVSNRSGTFAFTQQVTDDLSFASLLAGLRVRRDNGGRIAGSRHCIQLFCVG